MTTHHGPRRPRPDALIDEQAGVAELDDHAARERSAVLEELTASIPSAHHPRTPSAASRPCWPDCAAPPGTQRRPSRPVRDGTG